MAHESTDSGTLFITLSDGPPLARAFLTRFFERALLQAAAEMGIEFVVENQGRDEANEVLEQYAWTPTNVLRHLQHAVIRMRPLNDCREFLHLTAANES